MTRRHPPVLSGALGFPPEEAEPSEEVGTPEPWGDTAGSRGAARVCADGPLRPCGLRGRPPVLCPGTQSTFHNHSAVDSPGHPALGKRHVGPCVKTGAPAGCPHGNRGGCSPPPLPRQRGSRRTWPGSGGGSRIRRFWVLGAGVHRGAQYLLKEHTCGWTCLSSPLGHRGSLPSESPPRPRTGPVYSRCQSGSPRTQTPQQLHPGEGNWACQNQ